MQICAVGISANHLKRHRCCGCGTWLEGMESDGDVCGFRLLLLLMSVATAERRLEKQQVSFSCLRCSPLYPASTTAAQGLSTPTGESYSYKSSGTVEAQPGMESYTYNHGRHLPCPSGLTVASSMSFPASLPSTNQRTPRYGSASKPNSCTGNPSSCRHHHQ